MRSYLWQLIAALLRSALLGDGARRALMRTLGMAIHPSAVVRPGVWIGSRHLRMGERSFVNQQSFLDGSAPITLGDHVRLGVGVRIITGTHVYADSVLRRGPHSRDLQLPVVVERGAWIGSSATILPGVTIAEGCVIAAGAVVIRSTQPNGLYAGVPARRVKDLGTALDAARPTDPRAGPDTEGPHAP